MRRLRGSATEFNLTSNDPLYTLPAHNSYEWGSEEWKLWCDEYQHERQIVYLWIRRYSEQEISRYVWKQQQRSHKNNHTYKQYEEVIHSVNHVNNTTTTLPVPTRYHQSSSTRRTNNSRSVVNLHCLSAACWIISSIRNPSMHRDYNKWCRWAKQGIQRGLQCTLWIQ